MIIVLATPIADLFPKGTFDRINFPVLIALILLVGASFVIGLALRSAAGRRIGLVMFLLLFFFGWLVLYAPNLIPGYEAHRSAVNFVGDLIFISSFFVLSGEFWDKVRSLFIHGSKVQFPVLK